MKVLHARNLGLWTSSILVITLSLIIAMFVGWQLQHAFVQAFNTAISVSNARADIYGIRVAASREASVFFRQAPNHRPSDLTAYRNSRYSEAITKAQRDIQAAEANEALVPLLDIMRSHRAWERRTDAALLRKPYVFSVNDARHNSDAENKKLDTIFVILKNKEDTLQKTILSNVPIEFSFATFILMIIGIAGFTTLIFGIRLLHERERAQHLSLAFRSTTPSLPWVKLDGILSPMIEKETVSGDWYDIRVLPDGRLFITIGDVMGHGIEAAVKMLHVRSALLAAAIGEGDPAAVLAGVNNEHAISGRDCVAAICAYYDPTSMTLWYASAGLPAPILRTQESTHFLKYGGPPLGAWENFCYESHQERLSDDTYIVFYTDGAIEQSHDSCEGELLLSRFISNITGESLAQRLYDALFQNQKQRDDVAILTLQPLSIDAKEEPHRGRDHRQSFPKKPHKR